MKTLAQHLDTISKIVSNNRFVADREAKLRKKGYTLTSNSKSGSVGDFSVFSNRCIHVIYGSSVHSTRLVVEISQDEIKPLSIQKSKKIIKLATEENRYKNHVTSWGQVRFDNNKINGASQEALNVAYKLKLQHRSEKLILKHLQYFTPINKLF
jgi:hypothetical protein